VARPIIAHKNDNGIFFNVFFRQVKISVPKEDLLPDARTEYILKLEANLKKDTSDQLLLQKLHEAKDSSITIKRKDRYQFRDDNVISMGGKQYLSAEEYDSMQVSLPINKRAGWFEKRITRKIIQVNSKYRENPDEASKNLVNSLLHRLPYMLFVSLPLFAFILWIVYIRRRKAFYFADHGVFTLHLYIFSFILLLVLFSLSSLQSATNWDFLNIVYIILFLMLFVYLFVAMRKFYWQKWVKTFLKFQLVSVFSLVMMLVLFLFFLLFSVFTL